MAGARFRDLLAGTPLFARLSVLIDRAGSELLRGLGKNDLQHSQNIENILDRLVPEPVKTDSAAFDLGEVFLLLAGVYLHDIGRRSPVGHHEISTYEMLRETPERFQLRDRFEAEAVAQICAAHADESVWPINTCDPNYGIAGLTSSGRTFNLRRLGALLRFADELDNTYLRVRGIDGQARSPRQLIRDVNPLPELGTVEIQSSPTTWEDYELLQGIRDYTQRRLEEVRSVLQELGLRYYQVWLAPTDFAKPVRIDHSKAVLQNAILSLGVLMEPHYSHVELLPKVHGSEVSLLCTNECLGVRTTTAYLVAMSIDESLALEFRGALSNWKKKGDIQAGVVITLEPPAAEIVEMIRHGGFQALSLSDVSVQLYDFRKAVTKLKKAYEESEIFKKNQFVRPRGHSDGGMPLGDLLDYALTWTSSDSGTQMTVLGDFGSGKTTFADRLAYDAAMVYLAEPLKVRVPILVRLKDASPDASPEAFLAAHVANQLGSNLGLEQFNILNRAGRFLIILDGFDEMSELHSPERVLQAFRMVDAVVEPSSKVVLTCRTHFFKDHEEVRSVIDSSQLDRSVAKKHGYQMVFVPPFDESQVSEFVGRVAGEGAAAVMRDINEIYNLADLAQRPVLLNMIVKTIPQLRANREGVSVAQLYEMYAQYWLIRDDWRSSVSVGERRAMAEAVANHMFCQREQTIHYARIPELVGKWTGQKSTHEIALWDYELRTCNFLRRDYFGNYQFVHKSFLEYFLAATLCREFFANGNGDIGVDWCLPVEIGGAGASASNGLVASVETEDFFVQLVRNRLERQGPDSVVEILRGKRRKSVAFIRLLPRLGTSEYHEAIVGMLMDSEGCVEPKELAAALIRMSSDFRRTMRTVLKRAAGLSNLVHLWDVLAAFRELREHRLDGELEQLESLIESKEAEHEPKMGSGDAEAGGYPFGRIRRLEELKTAIAGKEGAEVIALAKSEFMRKWYREKGDYDRSLEKVARTRELEKARQFEREMRRRK